MALALQQLLFAFLVLYKSGPSHTTSARVSSLYFLGSLLQQHSCQNHALQPSQEPMVGRCIAEKVLPAYRYFLALS